MNETLVTRRNHRPARVHPYGSRPRVAVSSRSRSTELDQAQRRLEQLNWNNESSRSQSNSEALRYSSLLERETPVIWQPMPQRLNQSLRNRLITGVDPSGNPFLLPLRQRIADWLTYNEQLYHVTDFRRSSTNAPSSSVRNQNQRFRWATMFPVRQTDNGQVRIFPTIQITREDGTIVIPTQSSFFSPTENVTPNSQQQTSSTNFPAKKTEDKQIVLATVAVPEDIVDSFELDGLISDECDEATDEEEKIFQKVLEKKIKCDFCMTELKKYRCYKCFYSMCEDCTESLPRPHPWSITCPQCKESQNGFLHIRLPRF